VAGAVNGAGAPDAVVIGAGVVGAACAEALSAAGLRVLVLDAGFAGGGTTGAGMGHITVMDDSPAQLALTMWSRARWAELAPEMTPACEDVRAGTIWVAATEEELGAARDKQRAFAAAGVASEVLDGRALFAAEPELRPGLAGGLLVPDDRIIYQPAAARWLLARAAARGAVVRERCEVVSVAAGAVVVRAEQGASERIACGSIVNAAGIDAPRLTPGLPVVPRKGHLVITERRPGFCHHQLVELGYLASAQAMNPSSTAFNVQPRATGQLMIGSSRELVGRDASVNDRVLREMLARAQSFLPALGSAIANRIWTGFRPATPDSLPLIGAWPGAKGVWIAAGHEGLGITTATGTAAIIAAAITGGAMPLDAAPFDPARAMPERSAA
jgi:glycine/D-amino acid oxidase-like deaminating enzyme